MLNKVMLNYFHWSLIQEAERQLHFDFMKTPKVTRQQIQKMKMFGPVYHVTNKQQIIDDMGFKIFKGAARTGDVANGYELSYYHEGIPAPVHHLGFGAYFFTKKSVSKKMGKTDREYYLHVPRLETINWGSKNTMMKWWKKYGYDMTRLYDLEYPGAELQRVQATHNLTNNLKSKFDAVWYKGKGFGTLLDGDQICVYDANNIYEYDKSTDEGFEIEKGIWANLGTRFIFANTTKATAVITNITAVNNNRIYDPYFHMLGRSQYDLSINGYKDPSNEVYNYYAPLMRKAITNIPEFEELLQRAITNGNITTREEALEYYVKRKLDFSSHLVPSKFVGRILKKGERLK